MADKTFTKVRIQQKHDTAANWAKATNFVPLSGELIIYEPDESCAYYRFKVGNGEDVVSDLPFTGNAAMQVGDGKDSVIIIDGNATGDYSIAAGGTDQDLMNKLVEYFIHEGHIDVKPAEASGDLAVAYGTNSESVSMGAIGFGFNIISGCKGFYFSEVNGNTLTLSREMNNTVWDAEAQAELEKWAANDVVTINNDAKYAFCSKITSIQNSSSSASVTFDSLPFTEKQPVGNAKDYLEYIVYVPAKPTVGVVDAAYAAVAFGFNNKAAGSGAFAAGRDNIVGSDYGAAFGRENEVGYGSFATGWGNIAHDRYNFIGGAYNESGNNYTFATGSHNKVLGANSTAVGGSQTSLGGYSTSEGYSNTEATVQIPDLTKETSNETIKGAWNSEGFSLAKGNYSHVEGRDNLTLGLGSHAEGAHNIAEGDRSHAEGNYTTATGAEAHAEGDHTKATGEMSHSEGNSTTASGNNSHAEGQNTTASGLNSHAEGQNTKATGEASHATGNSTTASGLRSVAEGNNTVASGDNAHAAGYNTTAIGSNSFVTGYGTTSTKSFGHTEGYSNVKATNQVSGLSDDTATSTIETAWKKNPFTLVHANYGHAEGRDGLVLGLGGHVEGLQNEAKGNYSHASGRNNVAGYEAQFVVGKYNKNDANTLFEVGNGTSDSNRSTAFWVKKDGTTSLDAKIAQAGGASIEEFYPNEEASVMGNTLYYDYTTNKIYVIGKNQTKTIYDDYGRDLLTVGEGTVIFSFKGIFPRYPYTEEAVIYSFHRPDGTIYTLYLMVGAELETILETSFGSETYEYGTVDNGDYSAYYFRYGPIVQVQANPVGDYWGTIHLPYPVSSKYTVSGPPMNHSVVGYCIYSIGVSQYDYKACTIELNSSATATYGKRTDESATGDIIQGYVLTYFTDAPAGNPFEA